MAPRSRARIPSLLASLGALVVAALLWRNGLTGMAALFGAAALLLGALTLRPPGAGRSR